MIRALLRNSTSAESVLYRMRRSSSTIWVELASAGRQAAHVHRPRHSTT
jgi:hypothetical protein